MPNRSRQGGAATLAMALVLLLLITMVSFYTSRTVAIEQKLAGNDFRARQAFEAADSGLNMAIAYIGKPGAADKDGNGAIDPIFDTDSDGIGDVGTMTFADNSTVTVTVTGAFPAFAIDATGTSDDRTASRTVRTTAASTDALPFEPGNPLTARGSVIVNGSATVHNPEGNSTIWSGTDVDLGSNNSTATNIADPTDPNYPTCMESSMTCSTTSSSTKVAVGLDVIEHDTSLLNLSPEEMFRNYFGLSMANYRESRVTLEVAAADANNLASDPDNPGIHLGAGEVIWVEGDTTLSNITTVGCESPVTGSNICTADELDPSILIINGNLVTNGTPTFYGMVFVVGNLDLSSNTTVTGAIVAASDLNSSTSGSLDVWYNSDVLNSARDNGPVVGAPGTWHDW